MAAGDVITIVERAKAKKGNYFDGTDDYVLHDNHAIARVAADDSQGTYTALIYADNIVTGANQTFLSAGDNNSINEFLTFDITTNGKLRIFLKHTSATVFDIVETTASIFSRKWTHVGVVQNGTRPILYVNGKAVAMTDTTGSGAALTDWYDELPNVDKFAIGVKESNNTHTQDWKGAIGQVKYFNIGLSADEMMTEARNGTHTSENNRDDTIETARVFDITMENDGITDDGSGADNGTLTGNAHYGGSISTHSIAVEANSTGHAAEFINTFPLGSKFVSIIKRGD